MNALNDILKELIGLFVDDGFLALTIVATVIMAIFVAAVSPLMGGVVLVAGCLCMLLLSVMRAARR